MRPSDMQAGAQVALRAGVLFLSRVDGVLEVWDLLDRTHEPVATMQMCTVAATGLSFSPPSAAAAGGPLANARPAPQLLAAGGIT